MEAPSNETTPSLSDQIGAAFALLLPDLNKALVIKSVNDDRATVGRLIERLASASTNAGPEVRKAIDAKIIELLSAL